MQKLKLLLLALGIGSSVFSVSNTWGDENLTTISTKAEAHNRADAIYQNINFGKNKPLSKDVFRKAYVGFLNLKDAHKLNADENILSICDFSLSSNQKRLWVIDVKKSKVLYHSLVAHGQGTGEEFAVNFSNKENSHQTSLGFYITESTYSGDNGYSLRLHGMDIGYNDAAYDRAIVMHGADYVSEDFIRNNQRLGRSWGCPAVPRPLAEGIINTIKNNTCLFVYAPQKNYLAKSVWLNRTPRVASLDASLKDTYLKQLEASSKEENVSKPKATVTAAVAKSTEPSAAAIEKVEEPVEITFDGVKLSNGRP